MTREQLIASLRFDESMSQTNMPVDGKDFITFTITKGEFTRKLVYAGSGYLNNEEAVTESLAMALEDVRRDAGSIIDVSTFESKVFVPEFDEANITTMYNERILASRVHGGNTTTVSAGRPISWDTSPLNDVTAIRLTKDKDEVQEVNINGRKMGISNIVITPVAPEKENTFKRIMQILWNWIRP